MPTVMVDTWQYYYTEQPDRISPYEITGINRHGQRSWSAKQSDARYGSAQQGVFSRKQAKQFHWAFGFSAEEAEGPYVKTDALVFKDLGIPAGSTISDAYLSADWVTSAGTIGRQFRLYATKEQFLIARITSDWKGYDSVSQTDHFAQFGYSRRTRVSSYFVNQCHTDANVVFAPNGSGVISLPSFPSVVQELVNTVWWTPNSAFSLHLGGVVDGTPITYQVGSRSSIDLTCSDLIKLTVVYV